MSIRFALIVLAAAGFVACSDPGNGLDSGRCTGAACRDTGADGNSDAAADRTLVDRGPPPDSGDPSQRVIESLLIEPADVMLAATSAMPRPTQTFIVTGRRRDGTVTPPLTGVWTLAAPGLGTIDGATGVFTANGEVGGDARVRVAVATDGTELRAETGVTVTLSTVIVAMGTPAETAARFTGATTVMDPAAAANIVYPLNNAVMPQNVYPAEIQWLNGAMGDAFRIRLHKPHIDIVAYTAFATAGFTLSWLVETAAWRALAQTDVTDSATIHVDRFVAADGRVVTGAPVQLRFANGSVSGRVYYWDIAAGQARAIDDGTAERTTPIPTPPTSTDDGSNCMGCHAVSRDGRYFAGRLGGGGNNLGVVFDLTSDLSGTPARTTFPLSTTARWSYSSFSPDNSRLIIDPSVILRVINPLTGANMPALGGTLPGGTQPTWSPDGNSISYVANLDTGWGGEFRDSALWVIPVTGVDMYGTPRRIHNGNSLVAQREGGNADSYPSWTPDSRWIAFSHGDVGRSDIGRGGLYMLPVDATLATAPVRLNNACGGADTIDNFFPNFSPFDAGGYFWMSFLSRRDYGNSLAGTRGRALQQIWVAAVRRMPDGTMDPSQVAYRLPGQSRDSRNISAFWAPRPCRRDGEGCSVSSECCSSDCRAGVCTPPPPEMCRRVGQACGGSGCCAGLTCIANICSTPPG